VSRKLTATLAALALVLGACGGGGDSGDSSKSGAQTGTAPGAQAGVTGTTGATGATGADASKAQLSPARKALVTRADTVCRKADVEVKKINKRIASLSAHGGKANIQKAAGLYAQAVAIGRGVVRDLSAMKPAPADAAAYRRYLKIAREEVSILAVAQRALAKEDSAGFRVASAQINASKHEAQTVAQQFGFTVCGVG
jgi:hypothetical protein